MGHTARFGTRNKVELEEAILDLSVEVDRERLKRKDAEILLADFEAQVRRNELRSVLERGNQLLVVLQSWILVLWAKERNEKGDFERFARRWRGTGAGR